MRTVPIFDAGSPSSPVFLTPGFSLGGWIPAAVPDMPHPPASPRLEDDADKYFMFQAILTSMQNGHISSPNPAVGCVITKNNTIIARGCTRAWGDWHAERVAFSQVSEEDLQGSTIYLTMEPCTHTGRQPPCVTLFKNKGISRVVIAQIDPNPLVHNQGIRALQSYGIKVDVGPLASEARAWNSPFAVEKTGGGPFIAIKWAQSIDGCLADDENGWQWITGPFARKYTHWLRQKYDAIMVGASTVLNDFPSLDVRDIFLPSPRAPLKIIFDPKGHSFFCSAEIQKQLLPKTFKENTKKVFLIEKNMVQRIFKCVEEWCVYLRSSPEVLIVPLHKKSESITSTDILDCLRDANIESFLGRPLQSVFVEGGPRLLSLFVDGNDFDVAHVFFAPFVLGGVKNRMFSTNHSSTFAHMPRRIGNVKRWHTVATCPLGSDVLVEMVPIIS